MPITTIVVDRGLQLMGDRASGVAGAGVAIDAGGVDDNAAAFAAGDTSVAGSANKQTNALDSTPTRSAQTVSHVFTIAKTQFNGATIKRVYLQNGGANVHTALVAGASGYSIVKESTFAIEFTFKLAYTSG